VIAGNSASTGGGAFRGTLNDCSILRNSAQHGGGARDSTLIACTVISNSAIIYGGGVYGHPLGPTALTNCTLLGNSALYGGGAYGESTTTACTLVNCTVVGNSATGILNGATGDFGGGGADRSRLINCVVYHNQGAATQNDNVHRCTINSCCTTPLPLGGNGNITNAPLFVDLAGGNLHLQPNSPCIDAGLDLSGDVAHDLDGRPRPLDGNADGLPAFDMGAYEHAVLFVRQDSPNPSPPYNSWLSAATNLQDAANLTLAGAGDQILVTNGVYRYGGRAEGRLVADQALTTIQSVNGPLFTVIDGGGVVRCVYLENGTSLSGFTLTNGAAPNTSGGGVAFGGAPSDAVVSNCVIVGNSAKFGGGAASALYFGGDLPMGGMLVDCVLRSNTATGPFNPPLNPFGGGADNCKLYRCTIVGNSSSFDAGGVSASTLQNCLLTGNTAGTVGGGAIWSTLIQCTVVGNAASYGGGTYFSTLENSINFDNTSPNYVGGFLSYSCTTPLASGTGNITNAPLFIDQVNGNLRLQSNSPCINTGNNAYVEGSTDLDGRPRIVSGTVDIGAYEFQPGLSGEFIGWLAGFGLPTDGSADYADSDADGHNAWQEWRADTVPTNAASVLRLFAPTGTVAGVTVRWQSVLSRKYFVERSSDVGTPPVFSVIQTNIPGQAIETSFSDTDAIGPGPFFYRVGIR